MKLPGAKKFATVEATSVICNESFYGATYAACKVTVDLTSALFSTVNENNVGDVLFSVAPKAGDELPHVCDPNYNAPSNPGTTAPAPCIDDAISGVTLHLNNQ